LSNHKPTWLDAFMRKESLPSSFASIAVESYIPLAQLLANRSNSSDSPIVVGVNGAQGTGKSTLSALLALALENNHKLNTAVISIDDIYLTKQERLSLGEQVHPLLKTRGVPGTHDTELGISLLKKLKNKELVHIPTFNKATDDRHPIEQWVECAEDVDVILFEGWCVGAIPQSDPALTEACNALEKNEDGDGCWRKFVNEQLQNQYQELFSFLDILVMLKAPNFECVHEWRSLQEEKLRLKYENSLDQSVTEIMLPSQIERFIMHYERLTRWMLEEMPQRADHLLELTSDHNIKQNTSSKH